LGFSLNTVAYILMPVHSLDEGFKSSAYLPETLLDPDFAHSSQANKTALNKAFRFDGDMWSWFECPENRLRLARFGAAMSGLRNMSSPNAILEGAVMLCSFSEHPLIRNIELEGYSWEKLPEGSLVVDVGGGVGAQSLTLATHHSHLRFLIQDREPVIRDAIEVCVFNTTSDCERVSEKDIGYSTGRRICLMLSSPGA
jgi:hypothetical protein